MTQWNRRDMLSAAATLGAIIVAGFLSLSFSMAYGDEPAASQHPNDRANHHPIHDSVQENQAVVTDLGGNATAVSYWASAPDGWHVVTTVSTAIGTDSNDAEQHAIVRFSATLAPGQEQLVSVPMAVGERQQFLRIRRVGDRVEMDRTSDPAI